MLLRILSILGLIFSLITLYEIIIFISINPHANGITGASDSDIASLAGVFVLGLPALILGTIFGGVVILEGKERFYRNLSKVSLAITYVSVVIFLLNLTR